MTDELQQSAAKPAESPKKPNGVPFKKGFDKRRWMNGRGKKSPEQREGDEILRAVIWEELSREFDTVTMQPLESTEQIDAMRLMVRKWIKSKPNEVAERIAGKVAQGVDVTSGGEKVELVVIYDKPSGNPPTDAA